MERRRSRRGGALALAVGALFASLALMVTDDSAHPERWYSGDGDRVVVTP